MDRPYLVLQTKLPPPRLPRQTLVRPRLAALLAAGRDRRLTLVQAGTGYGKSTALAAMAQEAGAVAWYRRYGFRARPTDTRGPGMVFFQP